MLDRLISLLLVFLSLSQETLISYEEQMNLGGSLFLVNREYTLTSGYVPDDLVMPDVRCVTENVLLREEAAHALEEMCMAAERDGIILCALSGYRSYKTQAAVHDRKVRAVGKKKALRVSAPPGASEHQLGLAMDLCTVDDHGLTERFASTPEGLWVAEHAAEYGFIIRYKKEWEDITGYMYEPWHIRYVGRLHAMTITEMDIPLEIYVEGLRKESLERLSR